MHSLISDPLFCYRTVIFFWATASTNATFLWGDHNVSMEDSFPKAERPSLMKTPSLVEKNVRVNYHQVCGTNLLNN